MARDIETLLNIEMNSYNNSGDIVMNELPASTGVSSIFNKYTVFNYSRMSPGNPDGAGIRRDVLFDKKDQGGDLLEESDYSSNIISAVNDKRVEVNSLNDGINTELNYYKTPTAKTIIEYAKSQNPENSLFGPLPYSWSDFIYCKNYGLVPNNHLITLRRYPLPIWDNAKVTNGDAIPPIAQAVTWLGEHSGNKLSEVFKFSYGIPWKEIESKVQTVEGNEVGFGAGLPGVGGNSKALGAAGSLLNMARGDYKRWSGQLEKEVEWEKNSFGSEGPYWNQVLGPVNVINKTHMRDMGLDFKQDIKLVFEYSLRSFNNVNPKVAMLDLITNFLTLTYNNAKFWGGAMRYFPNAQDQVLFFGNQDSFYSGDWDGYFGSIKEEMTKFFNLGSASLTDFLKNPLEAIKSFVSGAGLNTLMGSVARKSRPHILSIRNLMSGNPIGEWHLTVGNPLNPIALIGNLLLSSVDVELGDKLGADDFPTEVKFTVTLKHARGRDKGDIESMFNLGNGKMSFSPFLTLPSEQGTYGNNYKSQVNDQRTKDFNSSGVNEDIGEEGINTMKRNISERLDKEWGPVYGGSNKNLDWIITRTKAKF